MALNTKVWLNAKQCVNISNLTISGDKGNSNGQINYKTPRFAAKDCTVGGTLYNVFEGSQVAGVKQKEVIIDNVNCPEATLQHNVLNVYTPEDNATITIKNCTFNLDPAKSNVLRMSNYYNAKNVTIVFDNVDLTYINGDMAWAGLFLYQAVDKKDDKESFKTWTVKFRNCKINGQKLTSNGFGSDYQAAYVYGVDGTGNPEDAAKYFTMKFE